MERTHLRHVLITRRLNAPPDRLYRAWAHPDELRAWFPDSVEGSLAVGTRSILVFPERRVYWDVLAAEPDHHFRFRCGWDERDVLVTQVTVTIERRGSGAVLTLEDGPFDVTKPEELDALLQATEGWSEALTMLRAQIDFYTDVRVRP